LQHYLNVLREKGALNFNAFNHVVKDRRDGGSFQLSLQTLTNKVVLGECIDVMSAMPECCIDLIVTSPPYNLGMKYAGRQNDELPWCDYWAFTRLWLEAAYRVLKVDGRICINHYLSCGSSARGRVAPLMKINCIAEDVGFKHHGVAVWDDPTVSRHTAWGSWLSASAPYINSPYEGILIMYKNRWRRDKPGVSTISKEQFIDGCHGVWKLRSEKNRDDHPAPFSLDLPMMCINLLSYKYDLVLDPFVGKGTTCVAAALSGRRYIGIDIARKYVETSERRIRKAMTYGKDVGNRKARKRSGASDKGIGRGRPDRLGGGVSGRHSGARTGRA
jgi:site-specific DNA-methyltransferase (adenine-specific)